MDSNYQQQPTENAQKSHFIGCTGGRWFQCCNFMRMVCLSCAHFVRISMRLVYSVRKFAKFLIDMMAYAGNVRSAHHTRQISLQTVISYRQIRFYWTVHLSSNGACDKLAVAAPAFARCTHTPPIAPATMWCAPVDRRRVHCVACVQCACLRHLAGPNNVQMWCERST